MVTYYLYEVPGKKNGATVNWEGRGKWNFKHYGIEPILIETMEGPDTPEMWKIVGDREWELADANGYERGTHYLKIRTATPSIEIRRESGRKQGRRNVESGQLARVRDPKNAAAVSARSEKRVSLQKRSCPHCGFISNPGGIAQHIKFKHKKRTAN